jgi:hypothetical protein
MSSIWNFEVFIWDNSTDTRCSWEYQATTFAEAEEFAKKDLMTGQEIIRIVRDYDNS